MTELVDAQFYAPFASSLTQTNGAGTFSFARSTTKSIFNSSGILESAAINAASINNFGLHIDPASKTNNLLYCRDLTKGGLINTTVPVRPIWRSGVIGSELVTNGTFNVDASGWSTLNCTLSAVSGVLRVTPTGAHTHARQAITTVAGKCYVITFTIVDINASTNGHVVLVGSSAFGGADLAGFSGDNSIGTPVSGIFKATTTTTYLTFYSPEPTKYHDLDDISVKESGIQVSLTETGIDGTANACSLLTASAANATILQTITAAATAACSGFWVKRSVGTGSIFFTRNGGTDWLDITSLINSSTFTCVKIENTSVTNPQVGFKIGTSGDAIIVDAGLNHAGTTLTLPILTTTAAVTRAADVLTYQTASNFSDTAGTILATYKPTYDTYASGSIVGSSTRGLYASTSNSGVQALDGTNTINGPAGTPSGQIKIGARWSGSLLQCFALDSFGSSGSYDGSFNLSTIGILPGTAGYIRDLAIWQSSLTDNEIRDAWNLITTYITSGSLVGMQSILSSSTYSISTVIYGSITATYVQPTLTATYTVPTIEAEI